MYISTCIMVHSPFLSDLQLLTLNPLKSDAFALTHANYKICNDHADVDESD